MKIVVIIDRATGNESVGTMWKETKIFDSSDTIEKIIEWARIEPIHGEIMSTDNIIITVPDQKIEVEE